MISKNLIKLEPEDESYPQSNSVVTLSLGLLSPPPIPRFQWYPQSEGILLNHSMKCCNSLPNAETQHLMHKVREYL